jgi:hypothetical protein
VEGDWNGLARVVENEALLPDAVLRQCLGVSTSTETPRSLRSSKRIASDAPGLSRLKVSVTQRDVICSAEALVTIADTLETSMSTAIVNTRGLPGYTFERAAGEFYFTTFAYFSRR